MNGYTDIFQMIENEARPGQVIRRGDMIYVRGVEQKTKGGGKMLNGILPLIVIDGIPTDYEQLKIFTPAIC